MDNVFTNNVNILLAKFANLLEDKEALFHFEMHIKLVGFSRLGACHFLSCHSANLSPDS